MALVVAEAAPGIDPDSADLEGLDLPDGGLALLGVVQDLHDHPIVDGELEELLDLLRGPGCPPVQEPEVPQPRGGKGPRASHQSWGGRLGRATSPDRRTS